MQKLQIWSTFLSHGKWISKIEGLDKHGEGRSLMACWKQHFGQSELEESYNVWCDESCTYASSRWKLANSDIAHTNIEQQPDISVHHPKTQSNSSILKIPVAKG